MKRPFTDQTNLNVPLSSDNNDCSDQIHILPESTQIQLLNFLDSITLIEQRTADQQKLKINHTIDHLILLVNDLPISYSHSQPPFKRNKYEGNHDLKDFQIKKTLIKSIFTHLFKIRNLIVSEPEENKGKEAEISLLSMESKKLKNKIADLELIEPDLCGKNQADQNSSNLPNGLYTVSLSDFTQFAPLPDSTTFDFQFSDAKPDNKSTKSFHISEESDDSISEHYLQKHEPLPQNLSNETVEPDQSEKSSHDENLNQAYLDDGVNRWLSTEHSSEDIVNYLRTNYEGGCSFKSFIDRTELLNNYERFFSSVKMPISPTIFYRLISTTLNVKKGTWGHTNRTPVYRHIARRGV